MTNYYQYYQFTDSLVQRKQERLRLVRMGKVSSFFCGKSGQLLQFYRLSPCGIT